MADKITTWQIDPNHSTVELAVKHMMFTTVRGRFKDVKGTIQANESNPDQVERGGGDRSGEHRHGTCRP